MRLFLSKARICSRPRFRPRCRAETGFFYGTVSFTDDGKKFFDSVLQEIGDTKRVFLVADEVMAKLSDTGAPQGVAAIVSIPPRTLDGAVSAMLP